MIITKLIGGMGNQLFQYAVGKALAVKNNTDLLFDITGYNHQSGFITPREYALKYFQIEEHFATSDDLKIFGKQEGSFIGRRIQNIPQKYFGIKNPKVFQESKHSFQKELLLLGDNIYLEGYWQTEKYFQDIADIIRKEFTLKKEFSVDDQEITQHIQNSNGISLHVRRGDYVSSPKANAHHGTCSPEYYASAIRLITVNIPDPHFFVFSDDIDWCKNNLKFNDPVTFVSDGKLKDYEELMLMSYCKHNIIANSSFSWWGAWLNKNQQKKVIAPKTWVQNTSVNISDVVPEKWRKI
jgi:hypothetical protein